LSAIFSDSSCLWKEINRASKTTNKFTPQHVWHTETQKRRVEVNLPSKDDIHSAAESFEKRYCRCSGVKQPDCTL